MTTLVQSIRPNKRPAFFGVRGFTRRALVIAAFVGVISLVPQGWEVAFDAMSEAYLAVAIFVAGTLALLSYAERGLKIDLGVWLSQHQKWQVPVATLLGAFPGCGGAIIAVTQYTRGHLSFGAVVATLIATMGDAMFLLLARDPQTALSVLAISMVVAVISGAIVDRVHGKDFLRPSTGSVGEAVSSNAKSNTAREVGGAEYLWLALMLPGAVIGVLAAFQVEADAYLASITDFEFGHWLGVAGAMLAVLMWAGAGESRFACNNNDVACDQRSSSTLQRVVDTTNFVTAWVVFAFVGYELLIVAGGIDLTHVFSVWAPIVPAIAILFGFIPGCGPQVLVTSMYLSGALPFSAQLGNAISNDGDALFPALAIAPKAAMVATLYSGVPAFIVAYGWYLWAEVGAI